MIPLPDESVVSAAPINKSPELIPLERRIIELTVSGHPHDELVWRIGVTEAALRLHLASIFDKLHVSNEFELLLYALNNHLVEPDEGCPASD